MARRKITVPKIRSSNIELGGDLRRPLDRGLRHPPRLRAAAAYHITEDFFFQGEAGRSNAGRTSFETLSGNIQLLTESERRFTYYDLSLGYNFLPGEAFIGRGLAMTSAFYLLGGIGGTDFAGDTKFTVNFGAGYRVRADGLAGDAHPGAGSCVPVEHAGHPSSPTTSRRASARPSSSRGECTDEEPPSSRLPPPSPSRCRRWPDRATAPRRPSPSPPRGGADVSLAQYKGQVVMLNFWASWCGPCRQEMPLLESIYKKYNKMGFTLIGVNVEPDSKAANDGSSRRR